jgi:Lipocalin-like domain
VKNVFAVLSLAALLAGADVAAQQVPRNAERQERLKRGSLQGVWQAAEVTVTGPGARTITIPEPRSNLIIFTERHYSRVEIHSEGPRAVPADVTKASADELRAVWGPFVAEAGTYETTGGNVITMRPLVAKNPLAMAPGVFVAYSYKLDGDTLTVTFQKDQNGPIANPVTIKAVRVE